VWLRRILSDRLSVCLFVYLSICLFVYLSVCLSICLSVCLFEICHRVLRPSFFVGKFFLGYFLAFFTMANGQPSLLSNSTTQIKKLSSLSILVLILIFTSSSMTVSAFASESTKVTPMRQVSSSSEEVYDLVVVGGGVVGLAILRAATLAGWKCALVEKEPDLLCWASGTNSGIICTVSSIYTSEKCKASKW